MPRRSLVALFLTCLLLASIPLGCLTSSEAAEGTVDPWPMARGDERFTGASDYNVTMHSPSLLWDIEPTGSSLINGSRYSSATTPVVSANGTIFIASSSRNISAISPIGEIFWTRQIDEIPSFGPALATDGSLYVAANSMDANNGSVIYSFAPNGSIVWKLGLVGNCIFPITVDSDGSIYLSISKTLTDAYGHTVQLNNYLVAVNNNGTVRWSVELPADWIKSPVISSIGVIYLMTGSHLYSITINGRIRWSYPLSTTSGFNFSQPLVTNTDEVEFINGTSVYRINPNGTLAWKSELNQFSSDGDHGSLIFDDENRITYGLKGDTLFAIDDNGTKLWSVNGNYYSSTYAPVLSKNGLIILFAFDSIEAYNASALGGGELIWRSERFDPSDVLAGPSGFAIGANGIIYLPMENGATNSLHLLAFDWQEEKVETVTNNDNALIIIAIIVADVLIAVALYIFWIRRKNQG